MNNVIAFGSGERDLVSKRCEASDLVNYINEAAQQDKH